MQHQRISLCMIVKDEEEHLPRCLESASGVVDEIIIVDTGSRDQTVAIAERYGAQVVHCPWRNDFAYARNAGLECAQGEWILFLDADEELDPEDRHKLPIYAQYEGFVGFLLPIHNHLSRDDHGAGINPVLRMFRNRTQHRFHGKIHEQISPQICAYNPDAVFHVIDVKIHHYGYRPEIVIKKNKVRRNIGLLSESIQLEPDNPFHSYNIGVEYLRIGQLRQAFEAFRKAREMLDPKTTHYVHLVYKYEIRCLYSMESYADALQLARDALQIYPDYTDLYHCRALCEMALGQTEKAKATLIRALEIGAAPPGYHTEEGIGGYQTVFMLGQLYEQCREYDRAIDCNIQTLRLKNSFNPAYQRIFHLMKSLEQEHLIIPLLHEFFSFTSGQSVRRIVSILIHCRCCQAAITLCEQHNSDKDINETIKLACYLKTGQLANAQKLLDNMRRKKKNLTDNHLQHSNAWIRWLQGTTRTNRTTRISNPRRIEPLIAFLESGKPASSGNTAELWGGMELIAQAAYYSGRSNHVQQIIARWTEGLQSQESNSAAGTKGLINCLIGFADLQLSRLARNASHRPLMQVVRANLPSEQEV